MIAPAPPSRDFHVRRTARERYGIDPGWIGIRGDLVVTDAAATRRLAARMNADRPAGAPGIVAGEIGALGLLHEIAHLLIDRYEATRRPGAMTSALADVRARLGPEADRLLDRFAVEFPGRGPDPEPAVERLEELLLIRIANENPAIGPLRELVDDRILADGTRYADAIAGLELSFAGADEPIPGGGSLIELIRAPARAAPTSLIGQLRYVRDHWAGLLGEDLDALLLRLDIAIGVLAEEERALHMRFGGGGGGTGEVHAPSLSGAAEEAEAFSSDSAWMPRLVLMAKSTYVWLDQLSRRYGRDIRTLDGIPDEELDTLAGWGVTGLWLIGLWERSVASERIKRMRGNADAVASAYSLDDYRIAGDLGGEDAYANLRDRAWARGIRLASDMVPNHMGIDSRWVIEHPEWFLSLPESPYPAYRFSGADLAPDDRVGVVLEDHYWDDSDAAVVFKRFDRGGGEDRYVYHGNDGTSFPWNDTAQLDFLNPEVREQVIRTILDVARRFPVIRFDAAMVLAKKHVQRLWWPLPGAGDGIPSRAQYAMTQAEFDARMPVEFWREVVDRVAAEVPGTLLLAEAFWMLEGYFVRTLGMHRVYNSAFMHMLRDENGAGYRRLIKETLEFDPEILKRYVNFMNNPDEKTALEQFGKGDKYFGVAMVMATMPGLPMLGHGQVEGYSEKYGMEYRRATLDEQPDPWLVERHERELFPLFHRRAWFAEAEDFLLYDLTTDDGRVDEDVIAYSNGSGPTRSLVIYHDRYGSTAGTIRDSAAFVRKSASGARRMVRRSLADGLGLPNDPSWFVAFRDARTGLEHLRNCRGLWERGLWLELDAYRGHVFWEFREIHDGSSGQWQRLAERLGGAGVPSLESAFRDLQLEPVHAPLRTVFDGGGVAGILAGTASADDLQAVEGRFAAFLAGVAEATGVSVDPAAPAALAATIRARVEAAFGAPLPDLSSSDQAALLAWLALSRIGALAPTGDVAATSSAWFDELRLGPVLAVGFRRAGLDEPAAWAAADQVRILLALPRPSGIRARGKARDARLIQRWVDRPAVRAAMGVNTWEGVEWLDRDRFAALLRWAVDLDAIETGSPPDVALVDRLVDAAARGDYRLERLTAAPTRTARAPRPAADTPMKSSDRRRPPEGS
ncbi:MAG: alpha-amylase family glycosyl hydrolase [Chloroflexota bacterium]|nr:alpha-amylase family glycosyl hydrolase [Chloroflexota bacterium]MDH5243360.1 alpha-amylase family glycosyl hydrolase [Chloroflexota bacterium]